MTAKEMFKELGYNQYVFVGTDNDMYIEYNKSCIDCEYHIHFLKNEMVVNMESEYGPFNVDVQTALAIMSQIIELGWISLRFVSEPVATSYKFYDR